MNRPLQTTRLPDSELSQAVQNWLRLHCGMITGMIRGAVFWLQPGTTNAELIASWPSVSDNLAETDAELHKVAASGEGVLVELPPVGDSPARDRFCYPLPHTPLANGQLVAVLEMTARSQEERQAFLNILGWGGEWLTFSLGKKRGGAGSESSAVFRVAAACLDQSTFQGLATTLVSELAARFRCQRVSLGLRKGKTTEVQVLSHSARFEQRTNLIRGIALAMDEAIDQDRVLVYPGETRTQTIITYAHAELASQITDARVCTLPFASHGEVVGAVTLEREGGNDFDADTLLQVEQLLAILAPTMVLQRLEEQSLPKKALRSLGDLLGSLPGTGRARQKLGLLAGLLLILFGLMTTGTWRVTADAVIEGNIQRTVAAPIDGFIAESFFRAGDTVSEGQELGALDDRDLKLERLKWSTLKQQMVRESRDAMARRNLSEVNIIRARIEQADAEIALLDQQLARVRLLSPLSGVVIEGDLSQSLGTPVSRGDVLFKVAPLEDYRIVLSVDEGDIAALTPNQSGVLILASMPGERLDLEVERITPVSNTGNGRNVFRVEASLRNPQPGLRPGMEGVGKVTIGERNLVWIWTRKLTNWLRVQTWTWWI